MRGNIALDIGTSGIRAQLLDQSGKILRTCITTRNPIPGANVMDHMTFALDYGMDVTHNIMISSIEETISKLNPDIIETVAVCGNPIQLSILESLDIRDLAYAGDNKLNGLGVRKQSRKGHIVDSKSIGLSFDAKVVVPPAVRHEIGADALAMMINSGFLESDYCMVTDYGTNAEMALKVGDDIFTGSAAAGPALEGQSINCGMLAGPGALSDLERTPRGWRAKVLDDDLKPCDGPMINIRSDITTSEGAVLRGLTGTGVIALVYAAMKDGRVRGSRIINEPIRIRRGIEFRSRDYVEAGKAIGAIRAGHMTLMHEADVTPDQIDTMFMAGASGTYVDPLKAMTIGMAIPRSKHVIQVGNTSLELARMIAANPDVLDYLNELGSKLCAKHIMFASSDFFSQVYMYEIGLWSDGMPVDRYKCLLENIGLKGYLDEISHPLIERTCTRDIKDIGSEITIIDPTTLMSGAWKCSRCGNCVNECPEKALEIRNDLFWINTGKCLGTACLRCEQNCQENAFDHSSFSIDK